MNKMLIIILVVIAGIAGITFSIHKNGIGNSDDGNDLSVVQPSNAGEAGITTIKTFHFPTAFVDSLKGDPKAGQRIFKSYCGHCHVEHPLIPVNAPKIGFPKDWAPYRKMPIDALVKMAGLGNGAMPSRGGCFECTDANLKTAIEFILKNSQKYDKAKTQ